MANIGKQLKKMKWNQNDLIMYEKKFLSQKGVQECLDMIAK
jgi:hypothetical protein